MVPPSEQPSTAPHEGGDAPLLHMLPNAEIHVIVAGVSAVPNLRAPVAPSHVWWGRPTACDPGSQPQAGDTAPAEESERWVVASVVARHRPPLLPARATRAPRAWLLTAGMLRLFLKPVCC